MRQGVHHMPYCTDHLFAASEDERAHILTTRSVPTGRRGRHQAASHVGPIRHANTHRKDA